MARCQSLLRFSEETPLSPFSMDLRAKVRPIITFLHSLETSHKNAVLGSMVESPAVHDCCFEVSLWLSQLPAPCDGMGDNCATGLGKASCLLASLPSTSKCTGLAFPAGTVNVLRQASGSSSRNLTVRVLTEIQDSPQAWIAAGLGAAFWIRYEIFVGLVDSSELQDCLFMNHRAGCRRIYREPGRALPP